MGRSYYVWPTCPRFICSTCAERLTARYGMERLWLLYGMACAPKRYYIYKERYVIDGGGFGDGKWPLRLPHDVTRPRVLRATGRFFIFIRRKSVTAPREQIGDRRRFLYICIGKQVREKS